VVVVTGDALTFEPLVLFNPVPGDQRYVEAPETVSCVIDPRQIVAAPLVESTGSEFTVTVTKAVSTQPLRSVPVRVYVCVLIGDAFTMGPLVVLRPVPGLQA
jgi:hypothetical protein